MGPHPARSPPLPVPLSSRGLRHLHPKGQEGKRETGHGSMQTRKPPS
jgi:hypothetical protein